MEQRLIDANALTKIIEREIYYAENPTIHKTLNYCLGVIDNAPTVDTPTYTDVIEANKEGYNTARRLYERPKGEWEDMSWFYHEPMYKCTHCNHILKIGYYSYCPKCGADMKGEEDD